MYIKPKKSLGQNFLTDKNILEKITSLTEIKNKDVLEVGPGSGNLTEYILKKNPSKLFVIEKDDLLCSFLKDKFSDKIEAINQDVLKLNEQNISKNKLIVFGNLPYNISTEILCNWILKLKSRVWFDELILMFQKEVAERILAKFNTRDYGRLSIISQWRLNIKKILDIKPSSFYPKPKIDSSLLHFVPKNNYVQINNSKNLELITRVFFNQRRKMIKKPLNQLFKNPLNVCEKFNLDLNLRPQNLSFEKYYLLAKEYESLRG